MDDMIEKVALAMWQQREGGFIPRTQRMKPDAIDFASGAWVMMLEQATVAIKAMREPSIAMRKVCTFEEAEVTYPAMIDAALSRHN